VLPRRRALPGGRAVAGGFLVAASAVGVFAAYRSAGAAPTTTYLVAAGDIRAGERIDAGDVARVALDLPDAQHRRVLRDPAVVDGAVALAPIAAGELVQVSDVARPDGAPDRAQISIPVDPGFALNGDVDLLDAGERVDVIVTYTAGGTPETSTVAADAEVVAVYRPEESVGGAGSVTIVLAVPRAQLEPVAQAAAAGQVTIARTTGVSGG
jgi:Flp pilus assembly protein CpaB